MAVKIVRQISQIALLGAPTSAAALSPGHEGAPAALRAAGLVERLKTVGYTVTDLGDDPPQLYKPDNESPRARNLSGVLASIEALKPRVEQAVKTGALPLILSGDRSIALATVAGARRYFREVGMIYFEREAGLQTPATTSTGRVDGMVVSHLTGQGAAEMVRFWGEPPLVREPGLALFGVGQLSAMEEDTLRHSTLRSYPAADVRRMGAAAAARAALERIHGTSHAFVLHLGVDAIADFQATDDPGTDGLSLEEVRAALEVFVKEPHLAALEVSAYNPSKDSGEGGAKTIVELLAEVLGKRLEALEAAAPAKPAAIEPGPSAAATAAPIAPPAENEPGLPAPAPGEAWSSESLEVTVETAEPAGEPASAEAQEAPEESGEPSS